MSQPVTETGKMLYQAIIKAKHIRIKNYKKHSRIYLKFEKNDNYYPEIVNFSLQKLATQVLWVQEALTIRENEYKDKIKILNKLV